jgi:hypothetical protein
MPDRVLARYRDTSVGPSKRTRLPLRPPGVPDASQGFTEPRGAYGSSRGFTEPRADFRNLAGLSGTSRGFAEPRGALLNLTGPNGHPTASFANPCDTRRPRWRPGGPVARSAVNPPRRREGYPAARRRPARDSAKRPIRKSVKKRRAPSGRMAFGTRLYVCSWELSASGPAGPRRIIGDHPMMLWNGNRTAGERRESPPLSRNLRMRKPTPCRP